MKMDIVSLFAYQMILSTKVLNLEMLANGSIDGHVVSKETQLKVISPHN
jgi:hypothetical protein